MATIIFKSNAPLPEREPVRQPTEPLEILFAAVGPKILKDELHSPWLSLTQVSRECQKFKIKWPAGNHKAGTIEKYADLYFNKISDVMKVDSVKVEYITKWVEKDRRSRIFLMFHQLDPANDCPIKTVYDDQ